MKYIDIELLRKDIDAWEKATADAVSEYSNGVRFALRHFTFLIDSLQQEQPEVDLEKTVEFECIGKKVKMTIQELINYYIDSECCDVADECGF